MWHPTVDQTLRTIEFYHVSRVGQIRRHSALLSAIVKMWRPEIHSFVMPAGEVTVTLEDVLHIFGLLIDGEVVTSWTDRNQNFLVNQSMAIFDSEPVRYVRCHIFCLLGTTFFVDKSTTYGHAKYLPLL
ncbi:uncharacterized protein DS421_20g697100 [Arachis hypogaea]|nr:uncharacterized protein DS421_20g697100 [Arachis hypogaea]